MNHEVLPQRPPRPARAPPAEPMPEPVRAAQLGGGSARAAEEGEEEVDARESKRRRQAEQEGDAAAVLAAAVWSEQGPVGFECVQPMM